MDFKGGASWRSWMSLEARIKWDKLNTRMAKEQLDLVSDLKFKPCVFISHVHYSLAGLHERIQQYVLILVNYSNAGNCISCTVLPDSDLFKTKPLWARIQQYETWKCIHTNTISQSIATALGRGRWAWAQLWAEEGWRTCEAVLLLILCMSFTKHLGTRKGKNSAI